MFGLSSNQASGLGAMGGGLASLFFNQDNPADSAMPFLNQIPGQVSPYYQPYINAGQNAMGSLQSQYGNLLNNPGGMLNQIGSSYQQSPGFQFALQQALQGSNHAMAAGGMAGSPEAMQYAQQTATNLGNQDYYNWLGGATGLYNEGLGGQQNMMNQGFNASNDLASQIAQMLAAKAGLAYAGQANQNKADSTGLGSLIGGAAKFLTL
jgi:hypothetical protein